METTQIIGVAIAGMTQLAKVIEMANEGDADAAEKMLHEARQNFDAALADWDAA